MSQVRCTCWTGERCSIFSLYLRSLFALRSSSVLALIPPAFTPISALTNADGRWERLIFNVFMMSVFVGTVIAMYIYCHNSGFLFALSAFLFGFLLVMLLLCPLHQY